VGGTERRCSDGGIVVKEEQVFLLSHRRETVGGRKAWQAPCLGGWKELQSVLKGGIAEGRHFSPGMYTGVIGMYGHESRNCCT